MMKTKKICGCFIGMFTAFLVAACAALQSDYTPPPRHPCEEGEDLRYCTDCHEEGEGPVSFEQFNHGILFADNHGAFSSRYGRTCKACHRENFCTDCHGFRIELKPSVKNPTENYRRMPHRGDYRTRHMFDGRLNPVSCYRCHGNPESFHTCKPCHG